MGKRARRRDAPIPHRCPVCEGRGMVQWDPDLPFGDSANAGPWPCRACSGTGIVWGSPRPVYVPSCWTGLPVAPAFTEVRGTGLPTVTEQADRLFYMDGTVARSSGGT